jgi:putative addiction module killer protein
VKDDHKYQLKYLTHEGKAYYEDWLRDLDAVTRGKVQFQVFKLRYGIGNQKPITGEESLYELKIDLGPGYRVYYSRVGRDILLILTASQKRDQNRTIKQAKNLLNAYLAQQEASKRSTGSKKLKNEGSSGKRKRKG